MQDYSIFPAYRLALMFLKFSKYLPSPVNRPNLLALMPDPFYATVRRHITCLQTRNHVKNTIEKIQKRFFRVEMEMRMDVTDCVTILLNSSDKKLMPYWFSCQVWLQPRIYPTWLQRVSASTNSKWRVCYWRKLFTCLAQRLIYAHCDTKQGIYF